MRGPAVFTAVLSVIASLAPSPGAAGGNVARCESYWKGVRSLNERFEKKRDIKAGQALWEKLPAEGKAPKKDCLGYSEAMETLERDAEYRMKLLERGSPSAFKLMFRLMNVADGNFSEALDVQIGKMIRKNPEQFLRYLKAERGDAYCAEGMLTNLGQPEPKPRAVAKELKARASALRTVKDPKLAALRDLCVERLSTKRLSMKR